MRCLAAVGELSCESGEPITTIALYTEPDAASWFVREASEAVSLGPALVTDERRRPAQRISGYRPADGGAGSRLRADAVWVGWGFVAESAEFAARCEKAGITFIGPPSDVIRLLGDKVRPSSSPRASGYRCCPGAAAQCTTRRARASRPELLGYPVLVKAAAGGGGRGIRLVESDQAMPHRPSRRHRARPTRRSAAPPVFIERQLRVRGTSRSRSSRTPTACAGRSASATAAFSGATRRSSRNPAAPPSTGRPSRGCATPRPAVPGRRVPQRGHGRVPASTRVTQEFMFMEVNTRLQVEHPVTEMTTGVDLVKLQLQVARGGGCRRPRPCAAGTRSRPG